MKGPLRIVFFGTPDFATTSLEAIYHSSHEIVGVVTATDKAGGRGQRLKESSVKIFAKNHGLPVFQPENLKEEHFIHQITALKADVFVVVAFRMMPKILFEIPPLGTFNLHGSLLPDYRGAAPINFAIINGEKETGVTTFFINEKMDEGNILLQEKLEIFSDEDAGSLHDRMMVLGAQTILKTLEGLRNNSLKEKPQPKVSNVKKAFKIYREDTRINWDRPSDAVYNFVRGLSPFPVSFTTLSIEGEEKDLKIYSGKPEKVFHKVKPGTLEFTKKMCKIYTQDGVFYPEELQLEGKKRVGVRDFINGLQSFENIFIV
ncbi:MAG: methionyl-tRNA formyltransferase [Bergeyella sp.]|nr:methionyl-tRNA formyltransferase [Bergeyella sp.]